MWDSEKCRKRRGECCSLLMQRGASGPAVLEPKHRDPKVPSQQAAQHRLLGPLLQMPSIFSWNKDIKTFAILMMRRMEMDAEVPVILASIWWVLRNIHVGAVNICQCPNCANSSGKWRTQVSISLKLASFTSIKNAILKQRSFTCFQRVPNWHTAEMRDAACLSKCNSCHLGAEQWLSA